MMTTSHSHTRGHFKIEEYFGVNVFGDRQQRERLSSSVYKKFKHCVEKEQPLPLEVVDAYAAALKDWALDKGATHFSHWFLPLTGKPAGKHDSFLAYTDNSMISEFNGKILLRNETDGSSFPSGGVRVTHEARGYTGWDPASNPFIVDLGSAPTLYIPSIFVSWKGHALDTRLPLLRSEQTLQRETLRMLKNSGFEGHTSVHTNSGVEQEFFLVDRDYYLKRPDLVSTGRTLLGAAPAKGQELEDQYFGTLSERMLRCIREIEEVMWRLGTPITTRHREVAPNQYEISPIYERGSLASEHNILMMEIMKIVARKHNLACLLHEKPFSGINGSGKHNNWSVGTNQIPTLFTPGDKPSENLIFMLMLAATIRAVDLHGDLIRWSISGASNDHRLGANEAPPAIISVYLGDDLEREMNAFISGKKAEPISTDLPLGVTYFPKVSTTRQTTDRNRTSPFAFTGNKFEVRAVGSSQNPAISNLMLNALIADSARFFADEIESAVAKNRSAPVTDIVKELIRKTLDKHQRVVFGGNGYDASWPIEAEKRGLPNLRTTPEVLHHIERKENVTFFSSLGIFNEEEFHSRVEVDYENYIKTISIESKSVINLVNTYVAPAVQKYQISVGKAIQSAVSVNANVTQQKALLQNLTNGLNDLLENTVALEKSLGQLKDLDTTEKQAKHCLGFLEKMNAIRKISDNLESHTDKTIWPLPSYHEILFLQD